VLGVAAVVCGVAGALAEDAPDQAQIARQLERVETLTERSSAARHVRQSTQVEAKARHAEAQALVRDAIAAYGAGDYAVAGNLLTRATRTMFEAARLANPAKVLAKKRRRDFDNRLTSVNALLKAHGRVSQEKGKEAESRALRELVEKRVARATELAGRGKVSEGRKALDEAYVAIKVAIESLRGGDTLVRSLSFATKEEEYHYEIDRNDTFRMLLDILVAEKVRANPGMARMVKTFLDQAAAGRARAEEQAKGGDFESAVQSLEQSTKHIGRAIRSAGVYIPG
jgi:hypothetical protein